jgi:hypothetical protein
MIKSAGFQLRINKMGGMPYGSALFQDYQEVINVDVVDGIVKNSWAKNSKASDDCLSKRRWQKQRRRKRFLRYD